MPFLTHDRINVSRSATKGVLMKAGLLWGGNALQSITIGRHTPRNPQQAIGYLGVVDYTTGQITSDVTLDTIIVEGCTKADRTTTTNSVNKFAQVPIALGTESYVMTSASQAWAAGAPATMNLGYMTPTMASHLDIKPIENPVQGEESAFAVVMGDDGSGIILVTEWYSGSAPPAGKVQWIDENGVLKTGNDGMDDGSLPAGVQSVNFSAQINHDNVLDVRTAQPIQFVTTYPINITADMEIFDPPTASGTKKPGETGYDADVYKHMLRDLKNLFIMSRAYTAKHPAEGATHSTVDTDCYGGIIGLTLVDESEAVSVGRYLAYTFNFQASDLILPVDAAPLE